MRFRIVTSLTIAALALGAAACGDDDKSSGDTLSKDEFVKQANKICDEYEKKGNAIEEPTDIKDADQAATYLTEASEVVDEGVAKLKALKPPDDVKSDWDTYIAKQEEGGKIISDAAAKAKAKDAGGLKDLNKLDAVSKDAKAAATKAGATSCASG